MSILGVSGTLAGAYQYAGRTQKTSANGAGFTERLQKTSEAINTSKVDAYTEYLKSKYENVRIQNVVREELEQAGSQESETKTEIIVKPDGSRVLVMTMSIGGMETTMSLEISKPTKIPNEKMEDQTKKETKKAQAQGTFEQERSLVTTMED